MLNSHFMGLIWAFNIVIGIIYLIFLSSGDEPKAFIYGLILAGIAGILREVQLRCDRIGFYK